MKKYLNETHLSNHIKRHNDIFTQLFSSKTTREIHKPIIQSKIAKIFCYTLHITYMHCKGTSQTTFATSHTTRHDIVSTILFL